MVVNGFVSVVISTIERRFDLRSTESGFIASAYDISSVICLVPVSYLGGLGSKPRWLGIGIFLLGLGSYMFALPHFWTGPYDYGSGQGLLNCRPGAFNTTSICDNKAPSHVSNYKYMLVIAQLLHGAGASPLFTLGVTYLDENLKAKVSPVYLGMCHQFIWVCHLKGHLKM